MSYESIPSLTNLKTQLDSNIYDNNSNAISGQDVNDAFDATIDNVSRYSSLFPNFDLAIPKQTIEFDVARTKEFLICSIANTGLTYADLFDKVGFRVTVTGTNKKQVVDVVAIWGGGDTTGFDIYTMTVGTGGVKNIYGGWPNTLNNGYPWYISAESPDSAQRHVKVEVFYDTPNVTWVNQLTDEPYNATYHSWMAIATTSSQIKSLRGIPINVSSANSATYAGMITSYLSTYMGGGTIYTAGTALTADNLIFQGTDGKGYPVSTTNVAIRTNVPIALCGTNASANGGLSFGNIREKGIVSFANTSATYDTFAQGDEVYLRCSMTNGAIYSDGVLANTMSAGYTWIEIGHAQSATTLSYNTSGKPFLTLDANGKLTHVNGQEIPIPTVPTISTSITTDASSNTKTASPKAVKTYVDSTERLSSVFPNFDGLTPKYTFTYNLSNLGVSTVMLFSLANSNIANDGLHDKVAFRVKIGSFYVDYYIIWHGIADTDFDMFTLVSNSSSTFPIGHSDFNIPKAVNNNGVWNLAVSNLPNTGSLVIEVYSDTPNVTWYSSPTPEIYSSSTHRYKNATPLVESVGLHSLNTIPFESKTSESSTYSEALTMDVVKRVNTSTLTLSLDTFYNYSDAATFGTASFTLPSDFTDLGSNKSRSILIRLKTGSSPAITFTSSASINYADGFALEASSIYEINCLYNGTEWILTAMKYGSQS